MTRLAALAAALTFAASALAQAPPPIPHPTDGYVVDKDENSCLECHDKPRDIGRKRAKNLPVPAPKSHYATLEPKPRIAPASYDCVKCHAAK